MIIRNLKELYCIIDFIISKLNKGDSVGINLKYSGNIYRIIEDSIEVVHVTNAVCFLNITYTESGVSISSEGSKSISSWLNDTKQSSYFKINSYLSFICSLDNADISSIVYNGNEIIDILKTSYGSVNLPSMLKYFNYENNNITSRIVLSNGKRTMPLIYSDGVFSRIVKVMDKHTLYINTDDAVNRLVSDNYISSMSTSYGIPAILTCIDMYRRCAKDSNCTFNIITNNS